MNRNPDLEGRFPAAAEERLRFRQGREGRARLRHPGRGTRRRPQGQRGLLQ